MEPCTLTPDLFHGRTRAETAALHPPPLRYTAVRKVNALIPRDEWQYAGCQERKLPFLLRRIEFTDHPLSMTRKLPEQVMEVWEILDERDSDRCVNLLLKRRIRPQDPPIWCYWDGICWQGGHQLGYAVWEAMVAQQEGLSSTGWRKDRWPNPPEY